jgi:hypothetical protein
MSSKQKLGQFFTTNASYILGITKLLLNITSDGLFKSIRYDTIDDGFGRKHFKRG